MKVLIDTHVFIWIDVEPERLSPQVVSLLQRTDVDIFVSVVSLWEIAIKQAIGKLMLTSALSDAIQMQQDTNRLHILPVTLPHVLSVQSLSLHHKDPFDRLLIAQAITENMTLASADPVFSSYPVNHLW